MPPRRPRRRPTARRPRRSARAPPGLLPRSARRPLRSMPPCRAFYLKSGRRRRLATSAQDLFEPALKRPGDRLAEGARLETLDGGLEEALDDEPLGLLEREPARAQVVQLLGVDLGDRRRMRAAHVVGKDLEAGNRVGVRLLGQQEVARLLKGIDLLRARIDLDHPRPDRVRAPV